MRDEFGRHLLDWYDRHARVLPWRVSPAERRAGVIPDPYRVWLSEVMLQQTTVAAVRGYFLRFTALWPDVGSLARAPDAQVMAEWAGLGYYARARNLLACARAVAARGGFPDSGEALRALPGIGPYTAAAVAAIAFDRSETVVDGNVERVVARLFDIAVPLPAAKPVLAAHAASLTPQRRPGDHAQAMMDLGATICTPRAPACGICPVAGFCAARAEGTQAARPVRTRKAAKPVRHGLVYVARRGDGAWLVETRPPGGLLGGMLAFPTSDWSEAPRDAPPCAATWSDPEIGIRHTFTHFHLRLALRTARLGIAAHPTRGTLVAASEFDPRALPTLMRKAHALAAPLLPD